MRVMIPWLLTALALCLRFQLHELWVQEKRPCQSHSGGPLTFWLRSISSSSWLKWPPLLLAAVVLDLVVFCLGGQGGNARSHFWMTPHGQVLRPFENATIDAWVTLVTILTFMCISLVTEIICSFLKDRCHYEFFHSSPCTLWKNTL